MSLQQQIEEAICAGFEIEWMALENESHQHAGPAAESHFKLTLVSPEFSDMSRVKRQQAVYRVLQELMPQFHALALHTYSPHEWQKRGEAAPLSPKCSGGH